MSTRVYPKWAFFQENWVIYLSSIMNCCGYKEVLTFFYFKIFIMTQWTNINLNEQYKFFLLKKTIGWFSKDYRFSLNKSWKSIIKGKLESFDWFFDNHSQLNKITLIRRPKLDSAFPKLETLWYFIMATILQKKNWLNYRFLLWKYIWIIQINSG